MGQEVSKSCVTIFRLFECLESFRPAFLNDKIYVEGEPAFKVKAGAIFEMSPGGSP